MSYGGATYGANQGPVQGLHNDDDDNTAIDEDNQNTEAENEELMDA
jgi:hypothetical protein